MTEPESYKTKDVQQLWTNAIGAFNSMESLDDLVGWVGQYAPDSEFQDDVQWYAREGIWDSFLITDTVYEAFNVFRRTYNPHLRANIGIAMAPDSQAFSFEDIIKRLIEENGE